MCTGLCLNTNRQSILAAPRQYFAISEFLIGMIFQIRLYSLIILYYYMLFNTVKLLLMNKHENVIDDIKIHGI